MARWALSTIERQAAFLVLAAAALANAGCLVVAAGAAAGGAACYAYCQGKVCENFVANFNDTWAASHTALNELGMPVETESREGAGGFIQTRTSDGDTVRLYLETTESRFPAEGSLTRVSIRVATFGDRPVSERILYQIGAHLTAAPAPPPAPPGAAPGATLAPIQPTPPLPQTPPPPLLPPEPVPAR